MARQSGREFVILRLQFARKADRIRKAIRLTGGPMVGWSVRHQTIGDGRTDQPSTDPMVGRAAMNLWGRPDRPTMSAPCGRLRQRILTRAALASASRPGWRGCGSGWRRGGPPAPGAWRERPERPGLAAQGAAVTEPRRAGRAEEQAEAVGVGHAGMFRGCGAAVKEKPGPRWPCGPGPS